MSSENEFDFKLVEENEKLLKEDNSIKKAKKLGRPKKEDSLRKKQVSTYLSDEEFQKFTEKLGGVPSSVALRNFVIDFIKKH